MTIYCTNNGRMIAVSAGYYLASCDNCGWVGSSEACGTSFDGGDDTEVYCPECGQRGADCGAVCTAARELDDDEVISAQAADIERLRAHIAELEGLLSSPGVLAIAMERRRQFVGESYPADRDHQPVGCLADAAACLAHRVAVVAGLAPAATTWETRTDSGYIPTPDRWPMALPWRPKTVGDDLARAGALLAAEYDRILTAGQR